MYSRFIDSISLFIQKIILFDRESQDLIYIIEYMKDFLPRFRWEKFHKGSI